MITVTLTAPTGAELVQRLNEFVGSPFELIASPACEFAGTAADTDDEQSATGLPIPASTMFPPGVGATMPNPPPQPAATVDSDTSAPTLDGRGCPWDERVHSGG